MHKGLNRQAQWAQPGCDWCHCESIPSALRRDGWLTCGACSKPIGGCMLVWQGGGMRCPLTRAWSCGVPPFVTHSPLSMVNVVANRERVEFRNVRDVQARGAFDALRFHAGFNERAYADATLVRNLAAPTWQHGRSRCPMTDCAERVEPGHLCDRHSDELEARDERVRDRIRSARAYYTDEIRDLQEQLAHARERLTSIEADVRNARWHNLRGVLLQDDIESLCEISPDGADLLEQDDEPGSSYPRAFPHEDSY